MKLTVKQAACRAGVSSSLIYAWCAGRLLRHYRPGKQGKRGKILIDEADLDAFLAGCAVEPAGQSLTGEPATRPSAEPFKALDSDRLLEAWRQQGVLADRPGAGSARSSGSSCGPSIQKGS